MELGAAVVEGFEVVDVSGSGRLFQAGSISKPVTAYLALQVLDHDDDLRRLLSHTAGYDAPFIPGHPQGEDAPPLVPRIEHPVGEFHYSGGGYVVVQQRIERETGRVVADVAREAVFEPLQMRDSTFEQPLPAPLRPRAARADWRVYPEAAAAGLWTTPADLARFLIAVQRTPEMLEPVVQLPNEGDWTVLPTLGIRAPDAHGLGVFLEGRDRFSHLGGAAGFFSLLTGSTRDGGGSVVMSSSDPTPDVFETALRIADERGWLGYRNDAS
ncbi:MAG: serine hydrolase domain-containing protein [Gaiellaceae bacterium]